MMMTTEVTPVLSVTGDDAIRALRHVVAEKGPDYRYKPPVPTQSSCVYAWDIDGTLTPQCIVGCALHHLGVPMDVMVGNACNNASVVGLARQLSDDGRYIIHQRAVEVFRSAQLVQDAALAPVPACKCESCAKRLAADSTWGAALASAEKAWAEEVTAGA